MAPEAATLETAVETPVVDTAAPAEPQSYAEVMAKWTPEQHRHWSLTGEEPAAAPAKPAETVNKPPEKSAPEKAKPAPDADAGKIDEPEDEDDAAAATMTSAAKKAFARLKRERAEFKGEIRALRAQIADQKPAAAASASAETKSTQTERPKRPRLSDPKYANDDGAEKFDADMDAYEDAKDRFENERKAVSQSGNTAGRLFESASEIASEADNFDEKAFGETPISWPLLNVLTGMKEGPKLLAYLYAHPDEAQEIANATLVAEDIDYPKALALADKDAKVARQFGLAEGIAGTRVQAILSSLKNPQKTPVPTPKPVTTTRATAPAQRVSANAAAIDDPVKAAYDRGDYAEGARLEAAADVARFKSR